MKNNSPERLLNYLKSFGEVSFTPCSFPENRQEGINFATIELLTSERIAEGMEKYLSETLDERNGFKAKIRFIELAEASNGRFRYAAEIVPLENVPYHLWEEVTGEYIKRLPHAIRNFRHLNPSKNRK